MQVFAAFQKQQMVQQQQQQLQQQLQQLQARQPQQQQQPLANPGVPTDIPELMRRTQMAQQAISILSQMQGQARAQAQNAAQPLGSTQPGQVHPQLAAAAGVSGGVGSSMGFPAGIGTFLANLQNPMSGPPGQEPKR
jgi:hypothetical protein